MGPCNIDVTNVGGYIWANGTKNGVRACGRADVRACERANGDWRIYIHVNISATWEKSLILTYIATETTWGTTTITRWKRRQLWAVKIPGVNTSSVYSFLRRWRNEGMDWWTRRRKKIHAYIQSIFLVIPSLIFFVVFFTIREKTRRCIGYTWIQQKRRHGTAVFIRRNIKNEKIFKNRRSRAADAMFG